MMTICLVDCARDSDCKGNEKCCSMGCHVQCVRPVPGKGGQGLGGRGPWPGQTPWTRIFLLTRSQTRSLPQEKVAVYLTPLQQHLQR